MLVALTSVATLFLKVPGPTGYYHLGDGVYYAAAIAFGPAAGALAGGLGGAIADVLGGWAHWAPVTLVLKGLGGWLAGRLGRSAQSAAGRIAALLPAAALTLFGYPLVTWQITGWPAALTEFYFNLGQVAAGLIVAALLVPVLERATRSWRRP